MTLPITITVGQTLPLSVQLWRIPHDCERIDVQVGNFRYGGNGYRAGRVRAAVANSGNPMPEVYRVSPDQTTPIGEAHQWLWRGINPDLSNEKFCTLFGNTLAWTNGTGFPGRRNYILQKDMDKELPRFHAAIINGGAVVEGEERYGQVYIRSMLISGSVPFSGELLDDPRLWFWGTSVNVRGEINYITRLGVDGQYHPVRVPILTKFPIWLPASELHKLPPGFLPPDAKWMAQ